MCDYCDCRSHPQIADLNADHEILLIQLNELERVVDAGDDAAAAKLLSPMSDLLHRHADKEERGVYPQLVEAGVDEEYVGRFEHEHRLIDTAAEAGTGTGWQSAARHLIDQLRDHIFNEETDLFPAAHQMLTPEQWDAIDAATGGTSAP